MAEHTPGPWTMTEPGDPGAYVENDPNSVGIMAVADGLSVAAVEGWDNALANARLIASAPDLLAALKGLADWTRDIRFGYGLRGPEIPLDRARAAIDKATGTETTDG